eukprot:3637753-Rhodomonas_salina.3
MSHSLPARPQTAVRRPISALAKKRKDDDKGRPASAPPDKHFDEEEEFLITPSAHYEQKQIAILRHQKKLQREERRRQEEAAREEAVSEQQSREIDEDEIGACKRFCIEENDRAAEHGKDYSLPHAENLTLQLHWNADGPPSVDLDISCVAFDDRLRVMEVTSFGSISLLQSPAKISGHNIRYCATR